MYHQFKELADVDITKEPMEIGPTCHYAMGGVEVDPDSQASLVPGLFAAGEVGGGMHGANRLGGNSLSDLIVFGKRAGDYAAAYVKELGAARPQASQADVADAAEDALSPLERPHSGKPVRHPPGAAGDNAGPGGHNPAWSTSCAKPWTDRGETARAGRSGERRGRAASITRPGIWPWTCATCCWSPKPSRRPPWSGRRARGGHTRDDYPQMSPTWRQVNLVCSLDGGGCTCGISRWCRCARTCSSCSIAGS
jgi:succinate dehydrogenase / fumarate reductase flavoprotein subunit